MDPQEQRRGGSRRARPAAPARRAAGCRPRPWRSPPSRRPGSSRRRRAEQAGSAAGRASSRRAGPGRAARRRRSAARRPTGRPARRRVGVLGVVRREPRDGPVGDVDPEHRRPAVAVGRDDERAAVRGPARAARPAVPVLRDVAQPRRRRVGDRRALHRGAIVAVDRRSTARTRSGARPGRSAARRLVLRRRRRTRALAGRDVDRDRRAQRRRARARATSSRPSAPSGLTSYTASSSERPGCGVRRAASAQRRARLGRSVRAAAAADAVGGTSPCR